MEGFENIDKPDLQNKSADIGIEVVQALSEDEGRLRSLANKILIDDRDREAFIERLDAADHFSEVLKKIEVKFEKLNNKIEDGYALFRTNGLYIFAESEQLSLREVNEMLPYIEQIAKPYDIKFDIFFINAVEKLYIIKERENIEQIDMDRDIIEKMRTEAL